MVLVFILCAIVIIITLLICMILLSTLKIQIHNFNLTNMQKSDSKAYQLIISLYLFNKIKWISIKLNDKKIKHMYQKMKFKKIDLKKLEQNFEIEDLRQIKKLNLKISYFDLKAKIGVEDVILTSFIVFVISTVISLILPYTIKKYEKNKYNYNIVPLYINKNVYEIKFDCIIEIKMVHIINIIYVFLKKRRVDSHEQRTSNRGSYAYSYE